MTERKLLSKNVYASVAHRYWNGQWSEAENTKIYGGDASVQGIGSNLCLELALDPAGESELVPALLGLKAKVDHQCLFAADSELAGRPSTLENVTIWLAESLRCDWVSLTVWETERLGCTIEKGKAGVRMRFRRNNLMLEIARNVDPESGLAVSRAEVARAVQDQLVKLNENHNEDPKRWSESLFDRLAESLPGLCSLTIDLGSHESLVVHS